MKYLHHYLMFLMFSIFCWNCADIIEPDLSEQQVSLISPLDSFATNLQTITFLWEDIDDVISYNIQIVKPDFVTPLIFVLDTNVTDNRFTTSLSPGEYQWSVIGRNNNTSTLSQVFSLIIVEDSLLNDQVVNLISPTDNTTTNDNDISFLWQTISSADSYRIQCASPDFSNSTFLVFNENITTDSYLANLPDGTYRWRVRAENTLGYSEYSEFGLSIDSQSPNAPVLLTPSDGTITTSPVSMEWTYDADAAIDSIYIYSDSLTNLVDSDGVIDLPYSFDNGLADSTYFWRVRSFDAAGNFSPFSDTWKFTIQ